MKEIIKLAERGLENFPQSCKTFAVPPKYLWVGLRRV